ncbi:sugar porter family MFS transporter [Leifsonia sp. ZF2019]|uniref:sugar porter family MFS transporter n=1 Tax=Leifsonia sp. ZF2019 TaxID=2781978 RepID=UPI001CBCD2F4|nr:sugar porter family MFS transporter [Leifsonia sp. ZF2019]UAJ78830.1 sugar porter family MFS transporter [Leifsonia sp. ZF2019]
MSVTTTPPARLQSRSRVILFSVVAAIGGFLFGFDTAIINGAVDPIEKSFHLSSVGIGVVVSITLFGAALGAFSTGWLADRIGRPRVMLIAAVVFAASAVGCGLSTGLWDLSFWRLLIGVSVGAVTVIGPLYISEIAPAHIRGRLSSLQQMAIVLGIFAALLSDASIAAGLSGADALHFLGLPAWRWMFIAGVVPAVVYGFASFLVPESPRYLVARGRDDAALRVLQRLENDSADASAAKVLEIRATLDSATRPRFSDLLSRRTGFLPIVWIGIALAALQSLVGIDVIFYYSTSLWQSVGFSESASFGLSVFSSIVNVVATVVAILLIDRVGRRRLLLIGSAGMFVSLAVVAIGFSSATTIDGALVLADDWGVLTLIGANVFVIAFAISWGPVVWVLLGEMFPNRIRGIALSVAATANWTCEVILNLTFPTLRDISLSGSYAIYAVMALVSWFVVYFGVRETRDRELEEMTSSVSAAAVRPRPLPRRRSAAR